MRNINIEIQLAEKSELDTALTLLRDAALWLKEKSIDYWQNWIDPDDSYINWIREGFVSNQFYFVYKDSRVIGMFRLQWSDGKFWGVQDNNAGYIHSFTIDKNYHGQGLGRQILALIEELCKNNDKRYLRLDCGVHVDRLCKYYEDYGFKSVGETIVDIYRLNLYEKEII